MYANNFLNADPTHIFTAKYYYKQSVLTDGSKEYTWTEFVTFRCKPTNPRFNRYSTPNQGYQRNAPDNAFVETKWAGIDYTVGDYVEYRGYKYQVKEIRRDETKVNPQVFYLMQNNPNTYYTLELEQINILDLNKEN